GLTDGNRGELARLPAELTPDVAAAPIDTHVFLNKGKASQGWRVVLDEEGEKRTPGDGALSHGALQLRSAEKTGSAEALTAQWSGSGPGRLGLEGSSPIDLHRESNGQLSLALDYRVTAAPTDGVEISMECGRQCRGSVPVADELRAAPAGEWRTLKIPLSC